MTLVVGNPDRDYSHLAREDPCCVYLIADGSLGMGPGKLAAQAFQAALWLATHESVPTEVREQVAAWAAEGARTIVRVAETAHIFERICNEVPGMALADEGLTEVQRGQVTIFCSWPVRRSQAHKLMAHKRVPLLS
jgi:peptidyl-tRNA hydrolase